MARWEIPFLQGKADVRSFAEEASLSLEEAARILRYQFLFSKAEERKVQAVAVGHTADDQVETVLMNIIRGAGFLGSTGMSMTSLPNEWSERIPLIRPLLPVWKEEIDDYCQAHHLSPIRDPSNQDLTFRRNRIRHRLIPFLEEFNPHVREKIWQLAEILREDYALLEKRTKTFYEGALQKAGEGYRAFSREDLRGMEVGDQRRLIRWVLRDLRPHLDQVSFDHVERARSFIDQPTERGVDNLVGKVRVKLREKTVYFMTWEAEIPLPDYPQMRKGQRLVINDPGPIHLSQGWVFELQSVNLGQIEIERILSNQDPYQAWVDAGEVVFPLTLAGRKEGERYSPLGMEGKRVSVSDLMINEKIPQEARERWPILRSEGKILWVPGHQIAHKARIRENTGKALHLSLEKRED
jgi:tRNA(Ile)-lysidine synthase